MGGRVYPIKLKYFHNIRKYILYGIVFAVLALLPAHAFAASVPLPDDAVIVINEFTFPATAGSSSERDLPAAFRSQVAVALQQAGFSVGQDAGVTSRDGQNASAPLTVTPLQEEAPQQNTTDEKTEETANDASVEAEDAATEPPLTEEPSQAEPETPATDRAAIYILEGEVTLFQETVGAANTIAGHTRIRTQVTMRCAYRIHDAATGKTLLTDVASANAARIVPESGEYDAVLEGLRSRAMTVAAAMITARLSGTYSPEDSAAPDRSYYQDSPGKRLR